jgi:DNA modification methylase
VKNDAQVLVNLGMIHKDGEWIPYWDGWIEWMRAAGWKRFGWYVWDQGPGLPGDWKGRLAPSHEFIWHFNRVAEKARKTKESKMAGKKVGGSGLRGKDGSVSEKGNAGGVYQNNKIPDSVVRVMRHKGGLGKSGSHPAVFPVDLVSEIMTAYSDPDDLVFEPFCGSGTQLISAQKNGRSCYGMELAPEYADVCVKRFEAFSGQTAKLESDGRTFAEVAASMESKKDKEYA